MAVSRWRGTAIPRFTGDIDFFIRSTQKNARSILAMLKAFGFGALAIRPDDLMLPNRVVQLGVPPNRIDLINAISGLTFEKAWAHRVSGDIDGLSV